MGIVEICLIAAAIGAVVFLAASIWHSADSSENVAEMQSNTQYQIETEKMRSEAALRREELDLEREQMLAEQEEGDDDLFLADGTVSTQSSYLV